MPVKLRLQRKGSKKRPFYFLVATDSRNPRDGKIIEKIGTYNPIVEPAVISLDIEKSLTWLQKGAIPTPIAKKILSMQGVLYYKHLLRGVSLGLFDKATAEKKFEEWKAKKESNATQQKNNLLNKHKEEKQKVIDASVKLAKAKNDALVKQKVENIETQASAAAQEAAETNA